MKKEEKQTLKAPAVQTSGKVLWFNSQTGKGRILGNDGHEYYLAAHHVLGGNELTKWSDVKFHAVSTSRGKRAENVEVQLKAHVPRQTLSNEHDGAKRFVPALKTSEGTTRYRAIQTTIEEHQKSIKKYVSYFALAIIVFGLLPALPIGISVFGVVIFLISLGIPTSIRMSESAYYTIPHSRDRNGKHRCICCGAQGVYRHTPYKTNSTLADCPKCGFELWSA